jgi:hypothetical protein
MSCDYDYHYSLAYCTHIIMHISRTFFERSWREEAKVVDYG